MKFDISNVNTLAIALAKVAIIYNKSNCREKLKSLGIEYDFWDDAECTSDYFAAGTCNGVLEILIRGTGGDTIMEKAAAWASDFDTTREGGRHRSARDASLWVLRELMDMDIGRFNRINIYGHSRGTLISPHLAIDLASKTGKSVIFFNFAYGPTFTNRGVQEIWVPAHEKYCIIGYQVRNPRDILCSDHVFGLKLRGTGPDDGADLPIATIDLPPDNWFQSLFRRVPSLIEHSPKEYSDGMIKKDKAHQDTVEFLKAARKLFVN